MTNLKNHSQRRERPLLSPSPLVCLPGLPGGTDSLWAQAVQPRPISSPHSDKMEGLRRRNGEVREQGGRGGKENTSRKFGRYLMRLHIVSEGARGLIASGSAATAGKLNKRCHTVALPVRILCQ